MRTLLINLTRFGDLLQCQAAISALAAQGASPVLVCLDNFAGAASLLRGLSGVYPLAGAGALSRLEQSWPSALGFLDRWKCELRASFAFERVCNLTPTVSARLLGRYLAEDRELTGFGLDRLGFGDTADPWAAFLQGASRMRGISPFNIVDLFRKMLRVGDVPADARLRAPDSEALAAQRMLLQRAPSECKGFVVLQLGASEERRRWPVDSFAAVGDALWQREGLCSVLVGSGSERPLGEEYRRHAAAPHVDRMGETSLPELAALLAASRLLISNDTGTMHLAAGLGTPVLALFFATAQPWDTGPYQENACSLEPDLPCHPCAFGTDCTNKQRCLRAVRPESVLDLALAFLRAGNWEGAADFAGARVWKSRFDSRGFMDLVSLSGHEGAERTLWLREQRRVYSQFFDRDRERPFAPQRREEALPLPPQAAAVLDRELGQAALLLDALIQQGRLLRQNPLPQVRQRFFSTWRRMAALLHASPRLAALSLLWQGETQGSGDLDAMLALAEHYLALFSALREGLPASCPAS